METEKKATEKTTELTTEKKLRNVRTCLYILILATITKLAMTDFTESYQSWISVIIIVLVIILVLAIERGIRKKLKEEK